MSRVSGSQGVKPRHLSIFEYPSLVQSKSDVERSVDCEKSSGDALDTNERSCPAIRVLEAPSLTLAGCIFSSDKLRVLTGAILARA